LGGGSARGGGGGASGGGGCVVVKGSRKEGNHFEAELRGFALGVSACGGGAFGRAAAAPFPSVFEFICCPGSGGGARQRPTLISSFSTDCASFAAK
jgi:hypothetical protein